MVADMNRLEQAARVSMGGFEDSEVSTPALPPAPHASLRLAALGLTVVIVAIAMFQFVS